MSRAVVTVPGSRRLRVAPPRSRSREHCSAASCGALLHGVFETTLFLNFYLLWSIWVVSVSPSLSPSLPPSLPLATTLVRPVKLHQLWGGKRVSYRVAHGSEQEPCRVDAALGRVARPRSAPGAVPVPRGCLAMSRPPDGSQPWSRSSWAASLGGSGASLPLAAPGGSPLPPLCAPSPWGCVCVWLHVLASRGRQSSDLEPVPSTVASC